MLSSVILWSLTAILGICSLILLSGHGAALIAGYNTMTEDEKKTIDEKKTLFCNGYFYVCMCTNNALHGTTWSKYTKHNSNHCGQYYCD